MPTYTIMDDQRISITYAQLAAALKSAKQSAIDCGSGDPPPGYEELEPKQVEVADACWHKGMDDLENAVLNWAWDELASARNEENARKVG